MVSSATSRVTSAALASALCALILGGCQSRHQALLDRADGLGPGSPVLVRGVEVGQVRDYTVRGDAVALEFSFEAGHDITLRGDACVSLGAFAQQPALVVTPGSEGSWGGGSLPSCAPAQPESSAQAPAVAAAPTELDAPPSPAGESASAGTAEPEPPAADSDAIAEAEPAEQPDPSAESVGQKRRGQAKRGKQARCGDGISFRTVRSQTLEPSFVLPNGGQKITFEFTNASSRTVELGAVSEAAFIDDTGRSWMPTSVPSMNLWFMPVVLAGDARVRVSVVFESDSMPLITRINYAVYC